MKKLLFILFALPFFANAQIITTVAGNGTGGYGGNGGPATSASVGNMVGIAFDLSGNYYFSENNYTVRKVSNTGIISIVSGTGVSGYNGDGIPATSAQLKRPVYIATDRFGNLYIPDENSNRVRKVDTFGIITTIAGTGTAGYNGDGIPATSAQLNQPYSICLDAIGNIYIEDLLNYRVRKIDTTGIITTYVGTGINGYGGDNGPATNAKITSTGVICTDALGNLYLNDAARVRKINAATKIITTYAGNGIFGYIGDNGPATNAELWSLNGVTSDAFNNIYIADGNRVRKVDTLGIIQTVAGDTAGGFIGDGGAATAAEFYSTRGVTFDLCGNLYVCDNGNGRIRKVTYPPILTIPTISLSGITTSAVGASVTITATVTNAGSSYLIHWLNHGIPFATTTVPSVTYTKPAGFDTITARVVSTATYGCYDSTTSTGHVVYVESGVTTITTKGVFTVYPNPAITELTVSASDKITSIAISNLLGQTMYTHQYNAQQVRIDVADLPKGLYFVKVNGKEVRKFMKE